MSRTEYTVGLYHLGLNVVQVPVDARKYFVDHKGGHPYILSYVDNVEELTDIEVYLAGSGEVPPEKFKKGYIGTVRYPYNKKQNVYIIK